MSRYPASTDKENALSDIMAQREETLEQIRKKKAEIHQLINDAFTPPTASNRYELFLNNVSRLMAIYDGVMVGMKIMRRFRRAFHK